MKKILPLFFTVLAFSNFFVVQAQSQASKPVFMPYCDATLWPLFDIQKTDSSKVCNYVLAFVVDDLTKTGANPCWGGYSSYDTSHFQNQIKQLRKSGGEVMVSFGGANGTELAGATTVLNDLIKAYQLVIDAYQLKYIDFDIEGTSVANSASIDLRNRAMLALKQNNPGLKIWLTLPVLPTGLDNNGLNVLRTAVVNYKIDIDGVNIMAMDYGQGGDMGNHAMQAGDSLFAQLKKAFADAGITKTPAQLWKKVGITPMIGQNDVPSETFYQSDASDLYAYALQHNIGILSMWSINRDKACKNPGDGLYLCTKITQQAFEFAGILRGPNNELSACGSITSIGEDAVMTVPAVYPNPSGDFMYIKNASPGTSIFIRDLSGRIVLQHSMHTAPVDVSSLSPGIYLIENTSPSQRSFFKMIKK